MPTSTPSAPPPELISPEAARAALAAHGAEAELALAELSANPALPELAALLGPEALGCALIDSPLDLAQAAAELTAMLPELRAIDTRLLRPGSLGRLFARSLASFMKGMRELKRRGLAASLAELDALAPERLRSALPRPFPEAGSEAHTLLALLERLAGAEDGPPRGGASPCGPHPSSIHQRPGGNAGGDTAPQSGRQAPPATPRGGASPCGSHHPTGCEVEVPHLSGYPAGGAYLLAFLCGLPLGEDELIEFSLPPSLGAAAQVRLIDALTRLGLLPPGQALSLHITCETPEELAGSLELASGMALTSFVLAYLYSADRRLGAGQIFKNFRLKRRGITGLAWPQAVGAEYRLVNVCTAAEEPGVLGDSLRAHEAQIGLAERLHAALVAHCLGQGGPWATLRQAVEGFVAERGLGELVGRERNVAGELATLFAARRTPARQRELLRLLSSGR